MKIFLSWSGDLSQSVAATLRKHLPLMIQSLDVFMSKHDIESGARWTNELAQELERTSFGILCLTKESLSSSWLNFEAGALARKHAEGRACGLLLAGLGLWMFSGPLYAISASPFSAGPISSLAKRYQQAARITVAN